MKLSNFEVMLYFGDTMVEKYDDERYMYCLLLDIVTESETSVSYGEH